MSAATRFCALLFFCALMGHGESWKQEETLSSVVAWKMKWVDEAMNTDWLTEMMHLRDGEGGLASALIDAKMWLAQARGHPSQIFRGQTRNALKMALLADREADNLGDCMRNFRACFLSRVLLRS